MLLFLPLTQRDGGVASSLAFQGWGFGLQRRHFIVLYGPGHKELLEVELTAQSDTLLELDFAEQPRLLEALSEGAGGLYELRVKYASGPGIAVLVLNNVHIEGPRRALTVGSLARAASGLRQFAEITVVNAALAGGVDYRCQFGAKIDR